MPTIKALVLSQETATAKDGGKFTRITYAGADQVSRNSVWFDGGSAPADLAGRVCTLKLEPSTYRGAPSDKVESCEPTTDDPTPYVRRTALNVDESLAWLRSEFSGDEEMLRILDAALFKNEQICKRFRDWPASKEVHHAFAGGLIEHTTCMVRIAKAVMACDVAAHGLDEGVVKASVVLHDVGKVVELDFKPGAPPQRSTAGLLLGHISVGDEFLCKVCAGLGLKTREGRVLAVRHCILSHHGTKEWGSPVVPATREAVLVHQLDMIQSRNEIANETCRNVPPGGRSQYNKQLGTEMHVFLK